ncbi:acetyltransferase [Corynebacterium phocae]|uniref:Acetyltransferase n=1 Tax=Corynebacterium phocae TaxID=161895 RepID=A0A1L7D4N2_9CORY|nr:GNAT family protein [Corynebacterium phocae]APT92963.1 acetyltransferase [Corynebacterium phocae]KAA8723298.1 GNAT family N-acetyltransferase [Corynebacterium phocae]
MLNLFGRAGRYYPNPPPPGAPRDELHPGWPESTPATMTAGGYRVRLRPMVRKDAEPWQQMRLLDEPHLKPVEPTVPVSWEQAHDKGAWARHFHFLRTSAREGTVVPLAIEVDGDFCGQLTLGNIQHGAISECWIGYWVYSQLHGQGIATAACALGVDHAFARVGLHRVTATYLPANPASGAVLEHCGFRQEGFLRGNLHINGAWEDHVFMAINRDDFANTAVQRLRAVGRLQ